MSDIVEKHIELAESWYNGNQSWVLAQLDSFSGMYAAKVALDMGVYMRSAYGFYEVDKLRRALELRISDGLL
jgi:hypothetical protein